MKTLEQGAEDFYLELDSHLEELEGTRGWELMRQALRAERLNALEVGLYDEEKSKEFYQGYLRAVEFLLQLPDRIRDGAEQIRSEQQAEDNLEASRRLAERTYQGGGEVA